MMVLKRVGTAGVAVVSILSAAATLHADTTSPKSKSFEQVPQVKLAAAEPAAEAPKTETRVEESSVVTEEVVSECDYTRRQSFDTYSSLRDGQPGEPGNIELHYSNGWQTQDGRSDPWLVQGRIEWTPRRLRNTQIALSMPLELLNGSVDGNADINIEWLQRLVQERPCCWYPTVSIINQLRVPSGYHSEGVDWTLTGVLAKELGPGTAYMNAFLRTANGENDFNTDNSSFAEGLFEDRDDANDRRHFQWGFRWGYKWRITDCFALIADYVTQSSYMNGQHNQHIGEVSAEWKVNKHLSIGPGILFTLDGMRQTTNFGAGVKLNYIFDTCF